MRNQPPPPQNYIKKQTLFGPENTCNLVLVIFFKFCVKNSDLLLSIKTQFFGKNLNDKTSLLSIKMSSGRGYLPADLLLKFLDLRGLQVLLVFEETASGCIQQLYLLHLQLSLHGCQPAEDGAVSTTSSALHHLFLFVPHGSTLEV